jgi:membrane protein
VKKFVPAGVKVTYDIGMETYQSWREDRTIRLGAGLAYYALFTIFPFFALTAALAEPLFGAADTQAYISERMSGLGIENAEVASASLTDELTDRTTQISMEIIGAASLIFAASLLFLALSDAVKTIWDVPVAEGMWNSIRRRLLSFAMVLIASLALVVSFALSAIVGAAEAFIPESLVFIEGLDQMLVNILSWGGLGLLVTLLFRFLSPVRVPWRFAIAAGGATAVLLVIGTAGVGWYLREFGGSSLTGAFGAILALLTWVYFEAQILLSGVQLSKVLTLRQSRSRSGAD